MHLNGLRCHDGESLDAFVVRKVGWAAMPETTRLNKTIDAWWPEIETFIATRTTNARTEAANVTIKNIKRTGRGYRSPTNYRCRIMAYNTARSAV